MKTTVIIVAFISVGCAKLSADHLENEEPAGPLEISEKTLEVLHVPPATNGSFFSFSTETYKLANGPARSWDGCAASAVVRGGYNNDSKCSKGYFHPAFVDHLDDHFFPCIEKASLAANFPQPRGVFVRHLGTYVNRESRNSNALSMHAYARGFDMAKFNLFDSQGSLTAVPLTKADYKNATKKFYDSFRQCWKDSLPAKCKPGQREYNGSIGHANSALGGNSLHNGHIHLSFPFCAG